MVDVLVILDGASEPFAAGGAPTSLELARTPVLDRLASEGELSRLRTVAPWLPAGSESAIPALLGWTPPAAVDRGAIEAAAWGIATGAGERAWRVDVLASDRVESAALSAARSTSVPDPARQREPEGAAELGKGRPAERELARAVATLRAAAPRHVVHRLAGHRLLLSGRAPLPDAARAAGLRAWPEGVVPPPILGDDTVVIGARGAAIGIARLMGAATVVPEGATGLPDSDLRGKAAAALDAIEAGAARVVVHVGGPDEAAHLRDRAAKVAAIERADRDLLGPLRAAIRAAGGTLRVCPDHGCDPATGEHDAAPVPCVTRSPSDRAVGEHDAPPVPRGTWSPRDPVPGEHDAPPAPRGTWTPRDPVPGARLAPDDDRVACSPRSSGRDPRLTERSVAMLPAIELTSVAAAVAVA